MTYKTMGVVAFALLMLAPAMAAERTEQQVTVQPKPGPEPLIVRREKLLLAGTRYEGDNSKGEIPKMWGEQFFARLGELEPRIAEKGVFYGAVRAMTAGVPVPFEYLAAAPVTSIEKLPKGIVGWELPAATYAVLPAHDVADIGKVMGYFHGTWLPQSKEWVYGGNYAFEYYPPSYSDDHMVYVYFPIARKQGGAPGQMTIYHPEPRIEQKGEMKLVGVEDLIIDGRCARTGKPVSSLFQAVAVRGHEIKHQVDANILIGDNRADDPARVWDGPNERHLAGNQVTAFEEVPADMTTRLLPASKYAIFSCEAPVDPKTKKPLMSADFGPLFPWYAFNRERWGFKDKLYYLEVYYHAEVPEMGYPIARYELWIPIE